MLSNDNLKDAIKVCEEAEEIFEDTDDEGAKLMFLRNWIFALVNEKYYWDAIKHVRKVLELDPLDA